MKQQLERTQRADGLRSRQTILDAAARLATIEGLEGLSIGRLAEHIGMSKSGLYAHFRSKEELQLATIETAARIFDADIVAPTTVVADPVERLIALCDGFLSYLERRVFPGGCFFAAVAAEFDAHSGPVRDRIAAFARSWTALFETEIDRAKAMGRLGSEAETSQVGFELRAFLLMANMSFVLFQESIALEHAARAYRKSLGVVDEPIS